MLQAWLWFGVMYIFFEQQLGPTTAKLFVREKSLDENDSISSSSNTTTILDTSALPSMLSKGTNGSAISLLISETAISKR